MVKLSAPRRIRTYFPMTCITTMFLGAWRGLYIVRVYLFKMLTTPLSASREGLSTVNRSVFNPTDTAFRLEDVPAPEIIPYPVRGRAHCLQWMRGTLPVLLLGVHSLLDNLSDSAC